MNNHGISRISRASDISFKELLEKREKIMRARDEYIEIPLDAPSKSIEMKNMADQDRKNPQTLTKTTSTPNIYQILENQQVIPNNNKNKNKGCHNIACLISIIGLIALNDFILLTYFI